jgi:hypothetical protein
MLSLPTKIMAGAIVALVLALGVVGWRYTAALKREGAIEQALDTAVAANVSLVKEAALAKAEAIRNQAISATALRENKALDEKVAAIKERLRNGTACLIDPADADALDGLFR